MKTVAIVQSRMGSQRLPGKALKEISGGPLLTHVFRRLKRCATLDDIVLATTTRSEDDALVELARAESVGSFRGSEKDVLSRFVGAARQTRAEGVVRITGDCPLIDPEVVSLVVKALVPEVDYVSNVDRRSYPRGLDCEAFFMDTLLRLDRMSCTNQAREHVTLLARGSDLFSVASVVDENDNSDLRWTVDTPEDLEHVRFLYEKLNLGNALRLSYRDIIAFQRGQLGSGGGNKGVTTWNPTDPLRDEDLALRCVRARDRLTLFAWANDPDTRAASFSTKPVRWEEHVRWFDQKSRNPSDLFLIGLDPTGRLVGFVRFEVSLGEAMVSIVVGPEHRGRGVGPALLRRSLTSPMTQGIRKFKAYVKPENSRSMRCFQEAEFVNRGPCRMKEHDAVEWGLTR